MAITLQPGHYLELLADEPVVPAPIDAIIVPTGRSAEHLLPMAALAAKTLTPLVALGSKAASGDSIAAVLEGRPGLEWAAIEVPPGYEHPLLHTTAADVIPEAARPGPHSDLSLKRNLGLLLGRQFGERIFFGDDDIQISPQQLCYAGCLLGRYALAGFRSTNFPDKSVVGHIEHDRRPPKLTDRPHREDVFISGNALAVNLARVDEHFPDIYNEDWLFIFNSIKRGMAISAGEAHQAPYEYLFESRAAREEFGETIADGLYDACVTGQIAKLVRASYWDGVIDLRRHRIGGLRDGRRRRVDLVLRAALAVSNHITPEVCAEYVESVHIDQLAWKARLAKQRTYDTLEDRLKALDLSIHASSPDFNTRAS